MAERVSLEEQLKTIDGRILLVKEFSPFVKYSGITIFLATVAILFAYEYCGFLLALSIAIAIPVGYLIFCATKKRLKIFVSEFVKSLRSPDNIPNKLTITDNVFIACTGVSFVNLVLRSLVDIGIDKIFILPIIIITVIVGPIYATKQAKEDMARLEKEKEEILKKIKKEKEIIGKKGLILK